MLNDKRNRKQGGVLQQFLKVVLTNMMVFGEVYIGQKMNLPDSIENREVHFLLDI